MISIREATEEDVESISNVFVAAYGEDYAHPEFYDTQVLKKLIFDDDALILVAVDDRSGRILGTGSVILDLGAFGDLLGEFGRLVVHPEGRNRGIGKALMKARVEQVQERLHIAVVENRAVHPFSQRISQTHGFSCAGFLPSKLKFADRENISYYVRHFGDALLLRRNHPHLVPEAYELADEVLRSVGLPGDVIVDADSPAYHDSETYQLEEMTSKGYATLLHFERGRVAHREIFGPVKLHVGLFQLRVSRYRYLLAYRNGHLVGGIGFHIDHREEAARILELVSVSSGPVRTLLEEVTRLCIENEKVKYIEADVSAYSPRMQRTFLELGYLPAAYVPAMTFHHVERLDAVRMVRLTSPLQVEGVEFDPASEAVSRIVTGLFRTHHVHPRLAEAVPRTPLFQDLNPEQSRSLAGIFTLARFEPGDLLAERGSLDGKAYLILSGEASVSLSQEGPPVGTVGPGEILGEFSLLRCAPHSAHATAATPVEAAVLSRQPLDQLVRRRPDIGLVLYRNLASQLGAKLIRTDLDHAG